MTRRQRILTVRTYFEPRDLWVGLYWDRKADGLYMYFCPFPTLVVLCVV